MIEAVFISDLHLSPHEPAITERFNRFTRWASQNTRSVYILGDFFHVWAGDDALTPWSRAIAARLSWLSSQGVKLYFMHGNRDFLLGRRFATLASLNLLQEPTVIELDEHKVLLSHGDRYCINDKGHQWLRRLTRNVVFSTLFMLLPYAFRNKIVNQVRQMSEINRNKPTERMEIVPSAMLNHMTKYQVNTLIHGHIHKPGLTTHQYHKGFYQQYVLSDWDDNPLLMCYDKSNSFYFRPLVE